MSETEQQNHGQDKGQAQGSEKRQPRNHSAKQADAKSSGSKVNVKRHSGGRPQPKNNNNNGGGKQQNNGKNNGHRRQRRSFAPTRTASPWCPRPPRKTWPS